MTIKEHKSILEMTVQQLIDKIERGRVIPFLGNDLCFLNNRISGEEISIEDFLARELAASLNFPYVNEKLFEIAVMAIKGNYDVYRLIRDIYEYIGKKKTKYEDFQFNTKYVDQIVEIDEFKTFLSVSFTDILQKKLIEKYKKENVEIISYSLSPVINIPKDKEIVVINLLGSIDGESQFAVTEEEYLEYFFNIISGSQSLLSMNESIYNRLKDNAFLYLGCNYPAWYTRYIVRGITQKRYTKHTLLNNLFIDDNIQPNAPHLDHSDKKFFKNYNSDILDDSTIDNMFSGLPPGAIVNNTSASRRFINSLSNALKLKKDFPLEFIGQVFISYYNPDKPWGLVLNDNFKIERIDKWFDEENLHSGEYDPEIEEKIRNCKIFLPLISPGVIKRIEDANKIQDAEAREKEKPYCVRVEWAIADLRWQSDTFNNKGNVSFRIMPCVEDGMDRQDPRIPSSFRKQRIYFYPSEKNKLIDDIKAYLQPLK